MFAAEQPSPPAGADYKTFVPRGTCMAAAVRYSAWFGGRSFAPRWLAQNPLADRIQKDTTGQSECGAEHRCRPFLGIRV